MGKHRNKNQHDQQSPGDHQKPSCHNEIKWPSFYPVRIEPSVEDTERYSDEHNYRRSQHTIGIWLNWITALGIIVALAGLGYLYGTLKVTQRTAMTTERQLNDFEAVEAAQIAVEFAPIVKMGKPGEGLIVHGAIDITNIGQTTAVDFAAVGYLWDRNLSPPRPGIPGYMGGTASITPLDVSGILLGNGKLQRFQVGLQIPQANEIKQGTWQSGIWVDFKYNDVFGHPHSGRDCFMVNPSNVLEFIRCPKPTDTVKIPLR